MKKIILTLITLISLQSCSQKKENEMEKKILELHNQVQKFENQKSYLLNINIKGCSVEVLINDIPVFHSFYDNKNGGLGGDIHINEYILNSGKQNIKINIFPASDKSGVLDKVLDNDLMCKINIDAGDFNKQKAKDFSRIYKYEFKLVYNENLPFITVNEEFEADVPYSIKGWSESMDLKKEKEDILEKELLTFYENYIKSVEQKDTSKYLDYLFCREKDIMISNYMNDELDSKNLLKNCIDDINTNQHFLSLDNYIMKFYGNGRVVALVRTDNKFREESVIIGETEGDYNFYPIYLHRPKAGGPLEVIR